MDTIDNKPNADEQTSSRRETLIAAGIIAALTLVVYGDVLLRFDQTVISSERGDTALYFAPFRAFAADEMSQGNLPLWNPHVFSGSPFLGGFQSAMLYPPNLMYMILPASFALNLDICAHTFLLGLFMFVWVRPRVRRPEAALFAAVLMMFGGPYALRVLAGQLTMLSSLAYAPLLLIAIDRVFEGVAEKRSVLGPVLLGILSTSLQVVAGYPGTVFMMAFTSVWYCAFRFVYAPRRLRTILPLVAIGICPVGITLVQLWVGAETAAESIRSGGGSFDFASSFSFPFKNLLTAVSPSFFGDNVYARYWGAWNFWDVSLFAGVGGTVFVLAGVVWGRGMWRGISVCLALLILFVSFGRYTPFYGWLYDYVPGFQSFRAPSKFLFFSMLFFSMLAALGLDEAFQQSGATRRIGALLTWPLGAALFTGTAAVLWSTRGNPEESGWAELLRASKTNSDHYVWWLIEDEYTKTTSLLAESSLAIAGVTALILGGLLWIAGSAKRDEIARRHVLCVVIAIASLELVLFARMYRGTFELDGLVRSAAVDKAYEQCNAGERVLDIVRFNGRARNYAMNVGGRIIWGYDPVILKRYGEFGAIAAGGWGHSRDILDPVFLWGSDPFSEALNLGFAADASQPLGPGEKFLRLTRPRFVVRTAVPEDYREFVSYITKSAAFNHEAPKFDEEKEGQESVVEVSVSYPEFFLATDYVVTPPTFETLQAMALNDVDFSKTVLLNEEPDPSPVSTQLPARFGVLDRSTDHFTIYVDLPADAILVATHAYAKGWRVVPEAGTVQTKYDVIPAYHALMAIPLKAGEHQFRLEYAPAGYRYGRWISLACLGAYLSAVGYWAWRRLREPSTPPA